MFRESIHIFIHSFIYSFVRSSTENDSFFGLQFVFVFPITHAAILFFSLSSWFFFPSGMICAFFARTEQSTLHHDRVCLFGSFRYKANQPLPRLLCGPTIPSSQAITKCCISNATSARPTSVSVRGILVSPEPALSRTPTS